MALTATLVNVTANELVYLIVNAATLGTTATIPATGGATPDLATDCVTNTWGRAACSKLRKVCRAGLDGLGAQAAGGWIQAEARDLLLGNGATQAGSPLMPRAEIDLQPLSGVAGGALAEADVDVDAGGIPEINLTAVAVAGECIMRIRLRSTPGVK
jgi:hypothetical protein